jgi:hypothetical protein
MVQAIANLPLSYFKLFNTFFLRIYNENKIKKRTKNYLITGDVVFCPSVVRC